jgi:hypothetical protein
MRDDLAKFTQIWDKAQGQNIFAQADAKAAAEREAKQINFFGQMPDVYDTQINADDMSQWNDVMKVMTDKYEPNNSDLLVEEKTPSKDKVKKHSEKGANTHNPVYPDSIGKDNNINPENDFTNGKNLDKLEELKKELHKLQVKFNKSEVLAKDTKKIEASISKIKDEIDQLSDMLNGNRVENENN